MDLDVGTPEILGCSDRNLVAEKIIRLALGHKMWLFGGYVRDIMVNNLETFSDLDLVTYYDEQLPNFLRILSLYAEFSAVEECKDANYKELSPLARTVFKFDVIKYQGKPLGRKIPIDVILYSCGNEYTADCALEFWKNDKVADLSCNIFYRTWDLPIGIRYIPDQLKYVIDPAGYLYWLCKERHFFPLIVKKKSNWRDFNKI